MVQQSDRQPIPLDENAQLMWGRWSEVDTPFEK